MQKDMAKIYIAQGYCHDVVKALDGACYYLGRLPTILLP
jgi:hypothetical protein